HARAIHGHRPIRHSVGKTTNCWAKGIWAACGSLRAPDRNDPSRAPPLQADPRARIFRECAVSAAARLGELHRSGGWHSRWRPLVFLPTFVRPARAHFANLAVGNTSRHKSVAHRVNRSHLAAIRRHWSSAAQQSYKSGRYRGAPPYRLLWTRTVGSWSARWRHSRSSRAP